MENFACDVIIRTIRKQLEYRGRIKKRYILKLFVSNLDAKY